MNIKNIPTNTLKRIQLNNYAGEHDSKGNQFDYEALGYKDAIDAELWRRLDNTDQLIKQYNKISEMRLKEAKTDNKEGLLVNTVTISQIDLEIERETLKLTILKAFRPWRYISNEIILKTT